MKEDEIVKRTGRRRLLSSPLYWACVQSGKHRAFYFSLWNGFTCDRCEQELWLDTNPPVGNDLGVSGVGVGPQGVEVHKIVLPANRPLTRAARFPLLRQNVDTF